MRFELAIVGFLVGLLAVQGCGSSNSGGGGSSGGSAGSGAGGGAGSGGGGTAGTGATGGSAGIGGGAGMGGGAGAPSDGGAGAPNDGGAGAPNDGGVEASDAGSGDYTGSAEVGVRCGDPIQTCAAGVACCAGLSGFTWFGNCSSTTDGKCGSTAVAPFACDGNEDCSGGDICCAAGFDTSNITSASCMASSACVSDSNTTRLPACLTDADCSGGTVCCALTNYIPLPLDMGMCLSSCA